jgi:PhnB protein
MKIVTYLMFEDKAEAALTFYAQCLGGRIDGLMRFAEMPDGEGQKMPPEYRQRVLHAQIRVGDQVLMGSDSPPQYRFEGYKGFGVTLDIETSAEAKRVFEALAEGGKVTMPFGETFWAERFGMLEDKFGVPWMINYTGNKAK